MKSYRWTIKFETGFVTFTTTSALSQEAAIEKAKTAPGCKDEQVASIKCDVDFSDNWESVEWRNPYDDPLSKQTKSRKKRRMPSKKPMELFENIDLLQALDTNEDLGGIWSEDKICTNWVLARLLMVAGMRADGNTYQTISKRLGLTRCRIGQLLWKFGRIYSQQIYHAQFE